MITREVVLTCVFALLGAAAARCDVFEPDQMCSPAPPGLDLPQPGPPSSPAMAPGRPSSTWAGPPPPPPDLPLSTAELLLLLRKWRSEPSVMFALALLMACLSFAFFVVGCAFRQTCTRREVVRASEPLDEADDDSDDGGIDGAEVGARAVHSSKGTASAAYIDV